MLVIEEIVPHVVCMAEIRNNKITQVLGHAKHTKHINEGREHTPKEVQHNV